jgi:hypothetical protein
VCVWHAYYTKERIAASPAAHTEREFPSRAVVEVSSHPSTSVWSHRCRHLGPHADVTMALSKERTRTRWDVPRKKKGDFGGVDRSWLFRLPLDACPHADHMLRFAALSRAPSPVGSTFE